VPSPSASEVGQRRFWNNIQDRPGIIFIGSWTGLQGAALWAGNPIATPVVNAQTGFVTGTAPAVDWQLVYTGEELMTGVLPFPVQFKTCRFWKMTYQESRAPLQEAGWEGTNEWILKPYSTDMDLMGPNSWMRGRDWRTANLFYDSCPFAIPTTLHYTAKIEIGGSGYPTYGFGGGGNLYGYLNDKYFGLNGFGGNKPNIGIGGKLSAVGDLSKSYGGFWGAFGINAGLAHPGPYSCEAEWVFDLCWRPEAAAMMALNGQISHLNPPADGQTEGWGTDMVPVQDNTIDKEDGSSETYLQFSVDVSGARETMNVYTTTGKQLQYGTDYVHDSCDKSGRSYRLAPGAIPADPCGGIYRLIVTYLVQAATLSRGKRSPREIDTNVGHDRLAGHDIRGL
jgi:hypothetical protein